MPKRSKRNTRQKINNKQTRVNQYNANRMLRSAKFDRTLSNYNNRFVEDRRLYNPNLGDIVKTRFGKPAKVVITSQPFQKNKTPNTRLEHRFVAPKDVLVCVRRKVRKEVMHALKKAGKSGQKRPTRNQFSNIKC